MPWQLYCRLVYHWPQPRVSQRVHSQTTDTSIRSQQNQSSWTEQYSIMRHQSRRICILLRNAIGGRKIVWTSTRMSRLLPKLMPLLVRAMLGGRSRWSSSHRRSIFHFPFVLSCFPTHLVLISLIMCCVFNPLFPPCLCVVLFILFHVMRTLVCCAGLC